MGDSSQTTDSAKLFHSAQEITGGSRKQPGAKDTDRQMIQEEEKQQTKEHEQRVEQEQAKGTLAL